MPTMVYACCTCGTTFDTLKEAAKCEEQGVDPRPSWLVEGATVWGFGENGITGPGVVAGFWVQNHFLGHRPMAYVTRIYGHDVSHNLENELPEDALDPMKGWDYLRYVAEDELLGEADDWVQACVALGIDPEPRNARWFNERSGKHVAFEEAVKSLRG